MQPGHSLRDHGLVELTAAIDALAQQGAHVHRGIHQARKAIRRTRALLGLGSPALGPGAELIDRQLRRVNQRLSPLRDAHALVETLDRLRHRARDDATKSTLDHARRIAARRRAAMAHAAGFAEALQHEQALLVTLRAALHGLAWDAVDVTSVTAAMAAQTRKTFAAHQRADARDDDAHWHRWRRRMRRISQQRAAALAAGIPAPDTAFDKHVAEQLGVLQDLSLLVAHCGKDSPFPGDKAALRRFAEKAQARQRKRIRSVASPVSNAP